MLRLLRDSRWRRLRSGGDKKPDGNTDERHTGCYSDDDADSTAPGAPSGDPGSLIDPEVTLVRGPPRTVCRRPVLHGGTPLVDSRSTVAFHPPCMRVPRESYRRCEHPSRGRIRIRKIRYGVTDQGEIDPAGPQESGPPCRLEQNPGGRPRLRRVLSEAGLEHAGQLVDIPEPCARGVLEHTAKERDRPAGLGEGDPVDGGIGGEAASPSLGQRHLAGSAGSEKPRCGPRCRTEPRQECPRRCDRPHGRRSAPAPARRPAHR
jgi:hypothetical protein